MQRVTVRAAVFVGPDLRVLEPDRIDHQSVSIPVAQFFAEKRRVRIFSMFAIRIERDQTVVAIPVKERHFLGALQNFKRQAAGVVPRDPADDAQRLGIDGCRDVVLPGRLTGWRQRQFQIRKILRYVAAGDGVFRALPIPAKVGMAIGHARRGFRWSGRLFCGQPLTEDGQRRAGQQGQNRGNTCESSRCVISHFPFSRSAVLFYS